MLLSIIYRFSSQGSAPSSGFSLPCAPGEDSCGWGGHSGVVVPSNQRTWGSANELLSLFKADVLFLSRPYQDLVAMQVPFENPVISPQCPSTPFHCNFNAQRILPILSNFLLEKCIKFQPRNILPFEIHRFIPHYVSWKSSSATLGMEKSLEYTEKWFCCCLTCLTSVGFRHRWNFQLLEKWGSRFFRSAFPCSHTCTLLFPCHFSVKHSHNSSPDPQEELVALNAQVGKKAKIHLWIWKAQRWRAPSCSNIVGAWEVPNQPHRSGNQLFAGGIWVFTAL